MNYRKPAGPSPFCRRRAGRLHSTGRAVGRPPAKRVRVAVEMESGARCEPTRRAICPVHRPNTEGQPPLGGGSGGGRKSKA
jgi:hypothetical protein